MVARKKGDTLDKMSRIDFSRMYTVEHNVKVYDFGNVHETYIPRLTQNWVQTFAAGLNIGTSRDEANQESSDSEDGDEEN